MVVQNDLDRRIAGVARIEIFEKADEFARAVSVFDARMDR